MYAGVDIGGTTTQVVLCAADLTVVDSVEVPTPAAEGGRAMVGAALAALDLLRERVPSRLLGVGVGAAGVVDSRAGRVLVASDSFRSWAGFPVTARVEEVLGVPAFLDNDVNAFLRGEVAKGAVAGEPAALGMTLGTGVGGALWLDGALLGARGAAGEIGHLPVSAICRARAAVVATWRRSPPAAPWRPLERADGALPDRPGHRRGGGRRRPRRALAVYEAAGAVAARS